MKTLIIFLFPLLFCSSSFTSISVVKSFEIKSSSCETNTSNTFIVEKIILTKFPKRKPNGKNWDVSWAGGPDVFFKLSKNHNLVKSSEQNEIKDFDYKDDVPFTFYADYTTTKINEIFTIDIFDKDAADHDFVDNVSFQPSRLSKNSTSKILIGNNEFIEIKLIYKFV